eukprot:5839251-Ditylum_brightwellii.AAC.2
MGCMSPVFGFASSALLPGKVGREDDIGDVVNLCNGFFIDKKVGNVRGERKEGVATAVKESEF